MAGLCAPLPTLRRHPRGCPRTARGRCGSLLLHRSGLPPPTPCRFLPAHRSAKLMQRPIRTRRPPNEVRRSYANFTYQAGSWTKSRRVVAKVEWHPGELCGAAHYLARLLGSFGHEVKLIAPQFYPRVGFIVTNMSRPAERVVAFYNKRGTCEQCWCGRPPTASIVPE